MNEVKNIRNNFVFFWVDSSFFDIMNLNYLFTV